MIKKSQYFSVGYVYFGSDGSSNHSSLLFVRNCVYIFRVHVCKTSYSTILRKWWKWLKMCLIIKRDFPLIKEVKIYSSVIVRWFGSSFVQFSLGPFRTPYPHLHLVVSLFCQKDYLCLKLSSGVCAIHQLFKFVNFLFFFLNFSFSINGVARTIKIVRTSEGDYWIKHWFSSISSLFQNGNFS